MSALHFTAAYFGQFLHCCNTKAAMASPRALRESLVRPAFPAVMGGPGLSRQ